METISIEPVGAVSSSPRNSKNQWVSCCFKINQPVTKYFVQVGILSGLIIYSATMMVIMPDCNSQRNYSSLLLFCLGILAPSPKMT
jgi:hypothetical protein